VVDVTEIKQGAIWQQSDGNFALLASAAPLAMGTAGANAIRVRLTLLLQWMCILASGGQKIQMRGTELVSFGTALASDQGHLMPSLSEIIGSK
jgi:hypothetical protein